MSVILTVNSLEQNVGVSSTVLTISERLNFFTKKNTCILELDFESPSFSYVLEKSDIGTKNIDGILPFINENTVIDDSLMGVIKFNSQSFKNSNIDIIYGTRKRTSLNNTQINILISALKKMYEIIVIDYGNKALPDIIMNNSDINILLIQPSSRYIESLNFKKKDYINKQTHLLLNNSSKSVTEISFMLRDKFKNTEVLGQLPSSNTLITNLLKGSINIEKGEYSKKINKIALNISNILSMEIKSKNSLTNKLLGKTEERESDVFIEEYEKIPLGQILIEENICTKEDIDRCLKLQAKRLG